MTSAVRFSLRLSVLFVSFLHAVDWTPGLAADHPDAVRILMMAQLAL